MADFVLPTIEGSSNSSQRANQDSYPRWKCTLIIRLEEYATDGSIIRYARAQKLLQDLKGGQPVAPLQAVIDQQAQAQGIRRYMLTSDPSAPQTRSPLDKAKQDQFDFEIPGITPWDIQFSRNGFHQADTLSFKVRLADFPFDPRVMRAVGVKFYLGTMPAQQSALSLETNFIQIPELWQDEQGRQRSNLRFKGWVDTLESEWPDDDEPTVNFSCRDNTSLLIDQEFPPAYSSPNLSEHPIDQAVAELLANFPQMEGFSVEYRPQGTTPPSLNGVLHDTAFRPNLGPTSHLTGGSGVGGGVGAAKLSVWDYITDITGAIGHSARVEDDTIVIQSVRTATSENYPQRVDDPYMPITPPELGGLTLKHRTFIYGRDISELKISRNYTKNAVPNVECRCYDPTSPTKVLVARFPTQVDASGRATKNGGYIVQTGIGSHPQTKFTVIRVSGIKSKEQLSAIAQAYYENLGRQEILITAKTKDLAAFGGDGADPDLFDVRAGDTVDILFRKSDKGNFQTYADIEDTMTNTARAVQFLTKLGFQADFAQMYAQQRQNAGFQTSYRVKTVGITCNEDDGVEVEIEMMNYVEVRASKINLESQKDDPSHNDGNRTITLPTVEITG